MRRLITLGAVLAVAAVACGGVTDSPDRRPLVTASTAGTVSPSTQPATQPDRTTTTLPKQVPPEEKPVTDDAVDTSKVPAELMARILADASARSGMSASDIYAVRAEQALWNDGSLGCPQPGMFYTQAQVDGYWVVLQAGDALLDYRASKSGSFLFCDAPSPG